jgi:hypothetical protein
MDKAKSLLEALAAGDVDTVLVGTQYAHAQKGNWYVKDMTINGVACYQVCWSGCGECAAEVVHGIYTARTMAEAKVNAARVTALLAVLEEVGEVLGAGMMEMESTIRTKSMHMKGLHERVLQSRAALATITKAKEICK